MYKKNKIRRAGKKLSETELALVEKKIGGPLPPQLREHYSLYNGGAPQKQWFLDGDGDEYSLHAFKPMLHRRVEGETLFEDTVVNMRKRNLLLKPYLPFATDDGGNFFCIRPDGSIYYCAMDSSEKLPNEGQRLAKSLVELVDGMVTEAEVL
jgi:hypothetical protein